MIRHIKEGVVPFDECKYSLKPLHPTIGEDIHISCLCDTGIPRLEIKGDINKIYELSKVEFNSYCFVIPAFIKPCSLSYRFFNDVESTNWYSLDILEKHIIDKPKDKGKNWIKLKNKLFLHLNIHKDQLKLKFSGKKNFVEENYNPHISIKFPEYALFSLIYNEKEILCIKALVLYLNSKAKPMFYEIEIESEYSHVYGTGEHFDAVDQYGKSSCGQVVEHFTEQGQWTYLPIPAFFTDAKFGFFRKSAINTEFTFNKTIKIASSFVKNMEDILFLGDIKNQIYNYIKVTGKPKLPPKWAFGLWISANGWNNEEEVREQLRQIKDNNYYATAMVLEAWSDESTFYKWSNVWEDSAKTVRLINDAGLHLVLWQIPVLKALKDCPKQDDMAKDIKTALENNYIVRHDDGSPYIIPERWFEGSYILDFTNKEACKWWFEKRKYLLDMGVEGFKTDGGEFLFGSDIALTDGTSGIEAHNIYPNSYIKAYHKFMKDNGISPLTFSRAGYMGAQKYPIHWAGDQLSTFGELKAQLYAGISAGLSGIIFWSFDIGGFAGELPSFELYIRATAFACFCPIMQWHSEPRSGQFYSSYDSQYNNDRSPWNLAEKLNNDSIIELSCHFASIRKTMQKYLWQEAKHCIRHNRPMMAHLALDFGDDEQALACDDEYMLGRKYLVAPIAEEGQNGRYVYLPHGKWRHKFTNKIYAGKGREFYNCTLNEILVFEKMEEK